MFKPHEAMDTMVPATLLCDRRCSPQVIKLYMLLPRDKLPSSVLARLLAAQGRSISTFVLCALKLFRDDLGANKQTNKWCALFGVPFLVGFGDVVVVIVVVDESASESCWPPLPHNN